MLTYNCQKCLEFIALSGGGFVLLLYIHFFTSWDCLRKQALLRGQFLKQSYFCVIYKGLLE